jgi:hypothetical protein
MAAVALGAAFAVSACGGRIWADREGPDGLRLHWYTQEATIEEAGARADEHCRPLGKEAVMTEEFEDQDITQAVFACR